MQERVQKFISSAGIASRRKAEEFIKSGQVFINGRKAKLGDKVDPASDIVKVYGKIVKPASDKIYLMVNKPKGVVVSKTDPKHRKTVFDLLPDEIRGKVWNVGRLDFDTEGLLIMTNDGELTQALAHPSFEHDKEYEVATQEMADDNQLDQLRAGVDIATGTTYPAKVKLMHHKSSSPHPNPSPKGSGQYAGPMVRIILHEGKKRQIRRMFDAVGLTVSNLKRIRINKLRLPADLPPGQYRIIKKEDIL
jgi:23S rRNA pseudouridine2605 synthase